MRRTVMALALSLVGCSSTITPGPLPSAVGAASESATSSPQPTVAAPAGAPWLVYQTAEGHPHVRLVRLDGTDDHELVEGSHPDWSPDGQSIAYEDASGGIWVIGVDGTGARQLFACAGTCAIGDSPAWSPDGTEIAFSTADAKDGHADTARITAVNVKTGALRTLVSTLGPVYPFYPRWSPDGKRLVVTFQAFATTSVDDCSPTGTAIFIADLSAAPAALQRLTQFKMHADYPDWSPDGSTIVFTTYDLGTREAGCAKDPAKPSDLYTIRPDGLDLRQLTHNQTSSSLIRPFDASLPGTASGPLAAQPTWATDGSGIVFTFADGPTWPGTEPWFISTVGGVVSAHPLIGSGAVIGEHPRLQPGRRSTG